VDLSRKTDVFKEVNKNTCTLLVPLGSKGNMKRLQAGKILRKLLKRNKIKIDQQFAII